MRTKEEIQSEIDTLAILESDGHLDGRICVDKIHDLKTELAKSKSIKDLQNESYKSGYEKSSETAKSILEHEIIGLKKEVEWLKKQNKELSKGYQKQEATEREKQFIESFGNMIAKTQKNLEPEYSQFVNDNFHKLLSE